MPGFTACAALIVERLIKFDMAVRPGSRKRLYGYHSQKSKRMENRPRSRNEYHTYRWTKESRLFREANPLCAKCWDNKKTTPSEVTDHIIPVEIHGDFWDKTNWQALCRKCNIIKGNEDKTQINALRKAY